MPSTRAALFVIVGLSVACTTDIDALTPAQREAVAAYVTSDPPSPQNPLDAQLGRHVKLLGFDLDRAQWRPGETMRVTWYWHVLAPPGEGWKLFTHIEDPRSGRALHQDGNGTIRWLYGSEHWRAAQYVRDVQDLHLPDDWSSETARLYVGIANGQERMPITGTAQHEDGRVLAVTLATPEHGGQEKPRGSLPRLAVVKTKRPPRLDGSLLDPVWGAAKASGSFVETRDGGPAPFDASAKLLWDARYLYVGVDVQDALLRASDAEHDAHLWEQDCVELMIDPDGDGRGYFEIQVSPRGVVFDTRYDSRRVPKPFGHVDWQSGTRVGVSARGKLDDADADAGYTVEIAIPWQAFSANRVSARAPAIGDEWRANLYVMDLGRERQRAAAWSPLGVGDFHVPGRFGILTFEGPPEDMQGNAEPTTIPPGRVPETFRRDPAGEPRLKGSAVEKRQQRHRLESSGGGY